MMVKRRLDYTRSVYRRVFHEGRIRNLDMDMGAHLWFAPDDVQVDMAGLVSANSRARRIIVSAETPAIDSAHSGEYPFSRR